METSFTMSIALRRSTCSMWSNVLTVVVLHVLLHDTVWLNSNVAQAKSYSGSTKGVINYSGSTQSEGWNDVPFGKTKSTAKLYNTFIHKMQENKLYFENLWAQNGESITKRGKRDSWGFEVGYRKINMSISQRIIPQLNNASNADFSQADLSKIVRLNDLKKIKYTEIEFDTLQKHANILNLAYNDIEYLDESVVKAFKNIERLDLAYNKIENFNLSVGENYSTQFSRLKILNLTANRLKSFQSARIKSLKGIDLSCNLFSEPTKFNLSQLIYLDYVDLSCNHLNTLQMETLQNVTNLKVLNLAGNHLSRIGRNQFDSLVNIEVLTLSNNNIIDIESDAFAYLANLQFLDLSNNNLSANSLHALQNIPDLNGLSVAYNKDLGNALQGFVTSWSIKELDVSGTGLSEIPAALAQSVHSLNLSQNHFAVNIYSPL